MDEATRARNSQPYRLEVTGSDGPSVTGRLRLPEDEALALIDQEFLVEDEQGRQARGRIVGKTPDEVIIEREDQKVLVKVVGHYL